MSTSRLDTLAAAVVASINDATLSQTATAVVDYRPVVSLPAIAALKVHVVPASRGTEIATRSQDDDTLAVFVVVRQKIDVSNSTAFAALNYYAEEIYEHLRRNNMTVAGTAYKWQASEFVPGSDPGYAPELMESPRAYASIIKVTYMGVV